MNLLKRIKDAFGITPKRRNVAGGMAWIRGITDNTGEGALNGRAVRTVALVDERKWLIDPPQAYIATSGALYLQQNILVQRGQSVVITAITDECLEPWKEDGVRDEEVRELYDAPPVKTKEPVCTKS